jgi:hypothetical protein
MHPRIKTFSFRHHRLYGGICGSVGLGLLGCSYFAASNAVILLGALLFAIGSVLVLTGLIHFAVPPQKMPRWIDPPAGGRTFLWKSCITATSLFLLVGGILLAIYIRDQQLKPPLRAAVAADYAQDVIPELPDRTDSRPHPLIGKASFGAARFFRLLR